MILKNYRQTNHHKSQTVKSTAKQNEHSVKAKREFLMPKKTVKIRSLNNIPQFHSPNCFDALRMTKDDYDKESEKQFNQNETNSHRPRSINSNIKAPTTVLLVDFIVKHVYGNAVM